MAWPATSSTTSHVSACCSQTSGSWVTSGGARAPRGGAGGGGRGRRTSAAGMVIDAISGSVGCAAVGGAQPAHRTGATWARGVADLAPVAVAELDDVSPNGPDAEQS